MRPRLFCSLLALTSVVAAQGDAGDRFWNQDRGNGWGNSSVDVDPVLSVPEDVWRASPGELVGAPVVWDGRVFTLARRGKQVTLYELDAATGETLGKASVGKVEDARLAAWEDLVAVCTEQFVRTFRVKGKSLRKRDTLELGTLGPPCVAGGELFVRDLENQLHLIDLAEGEDTGEIGTCEGRPSVSPRLVGIYELDERGGSEEQYVSLRSLKRASPDEPYKIATHEWGGSVRRSNKPFGRDEAVVCFLAEVGRKSIWYVRPHRPLESFFESLKMPAALLGVERSAGVSPILIGPILWKDELVGLDADSNLVAQDKKGGFRTILLASQRPPGARDGAITRARGVAYVGNTGVDLEKMRVLWVAPDLDAAGPLIPLADRRILYVSREGELVCAASSSTGVAAGAEGGPAAFASLPAPSSGDGVVLADGTFRVGKAQARMGGGAVLNLGTEFAEEFERTAVSAVVSGGKVELVGEEYPVVVAFRNSLSAELSDVLPTWFEAYRRAGFYTECERLLAEARTVGLSEEKLAELGAELAGKSEGTISHREQKLLKVSAVEEEGRQRLVELCRGAAGWCGEHGLPRAATLLEADASLFAPGTAADPERLAGWIPAEFPLGQGEEAAGTWLTWARELVPAGARFVGEDDEHAKAPWVIETSEPALVLRTRNLVLSSRSRDPEALGVVLRAAEGVARELTSLVPDSEAFRTPLELRLVADETALRAAREEASLGKMEHAAGGYDRAGKVCTFALPSRPTRAASLAALRDATVHAVTHQFLAERGVLRTKGISRSGTWAVEGIARYMEDRPVDLGRPESDRRAEVPPSVRIAAAILGRGELIPLRSLLLMPQTAVGRLKRDAPLELDLPEPLGAQSLSARQLFQREAGAFTFFLLERAGRQSRDGFVRYLQAVYAGEWTSRSWKLLGYDSLDTLDDVFNAFLLESGTG